MRLEINELISEYFKSIRNDYPDLSFSTVKEIVLGPWDFMKSVFESGSLEKVRLKYFGVFQVPPGRARGYLEEAKRKFEKNYMQPKLYFKIKNNIETYLKKLEDEKLEEDDE